MFVVTLSILNSAEGDVEEGRIHSAEGDVVEGRIHSAEGEEKKV